jgi:hypothetical protein
MKPVKSGEIYTFRHARFMPGLCTTFFFELATLDVYLVY